MTEPIVDRVLRSARYRDVDRALLDRLAAGPGLGEQYYLTGGTSVRWAGTVIIEETGKTADEAKRLLAAWKKEGLIGPADYDSPGDRKKRSGLWVNAVKVSEMRLSAAGD